MKNLDSLKIIKVDDCLGLLFGFAIISKMDGEDYYDLQDDHITEDAVLKAALDFSAYSDRAAKLMHAGWPIGRVVFMFPLTDEIAKALDIKTNKTGLIIGIKVHDEKILEAYQEGTFTGFSIGGKIVSIEDIQGD